jgi:hypothetical protein
MVLPSSSVWAQRDHYNPGVEYDLAVTSIDTPAAALVAPGVPFYPAFTFHNFGIYYQDSIWAYFSITDSLSLPVYLDSLLVADSLAPDSIRQVVLGTTFVPDTLMRYTASAYIFMAGDEDPGNDTLRFDFATFENIGTIQGFVADENAGGAPLDGAVVSAVCGGTSLFDTTESGNYGFPSAPVGGYTVTARKSGYFDSTVAAINLGIGATEVVNFSLGYPTVTLSPAESVCVTLSPGSADSSQYLKLQIGGTRDLQYTVEWPERQAKGKALGDSLWGLDVTGVTGDDLCLGVEFDGTNLWVTGAAGDPASDPNYLYKLDKSGGLLDSYAQPAGNGWGWRDLCFDGTYLYAASGDSIEQIDTANGTPTGVKIFTHTGTCRGLAYDPASDCFYTANYTDSIYQVDRYGNRVNAWVNGRYIFGLAWDATAPDGPWLWVFSQDGFPQIKAGQFDPIAGNYTGVEFQGRAVDPVNACAGGATFTTNLVPGRGILLGLIQDSFDRLVGYDTRPHNAPWLSLSKDSGSFTPPDSDSIRLTFATAGLDSNLTYRARIAVFDQKGTVRDTVTAILRFPTGVGGQEVSDVILTGRTSIRTSPNPFGRVTTINLQLTKPGPASLSAYNISGQLVKTILSGQQLAGGAHRFQWNGTGDEGRSLPNGIYFLRLKTSDERLIHKMVLLR